MIARIKLNNANNDTNAMNNVQRNNIVKTGKNLVDYTKRELVREFSALNAKVEPSQIDALARAIVLGLIKGGEETQA